jgi:hypothetical protein
MRKPTYAVYVLIDPRDNDVRYVGITDNPDRRLEEHLSGRGGNIPKRIWIKELCQLGLAPTMQLLETGLSLSAAMERENSLIQHYLNAGKTLVNLRQTPYVSRKRISETVAANKPIKVKLDDLITEAGLRKSELAKKARMNESTLIRICRGQPTTRATISKLLNIIEAHSGRKISPDIIEGINIVD